MPVPLGEKLQITPLEVAKERQETLRRYAEHALRMHEENAQATVEDFNKVETAYQRVVTGMPRNVIASPAGNADYFDEVLQLQGGLFMKWRLFAW
jgi:hypothetical protein